MDIFRRSGSDSARGSTIDPSASSRSALEPHEPERVGSGLLGSIETARSTQCAVWPFVKVGRNASRHVEGVVAETFVETRHEGELDDDRDRHPSRGEFRYEGDVQLVHLIVELVKTDGEVRRAFAVGVRGH